MPPLAPGVAIAMKLLAACLAIGSTLPGCLWASQTSEATTGYAVQAVLGDAPHLEGAAVPAHARPAPPGAPTCTSTTDPPGACRAAITAQQPGMAIRGYYLGCPGWGVKSWVGRLFPTSTRPTEFLERYARVFNTVEGNTTFYALPT